MPNIRSYLTHNFTKAFLTILLPFFLIVSLVYLVRISSLTAKIQITVTELLTLYSYSIPDIIFYTLPLSFVAALANVLVRLSQSNELIALYALGRNAQKVLSPLLVLSILFSLLLFAISFLAMPLSKQLYKEFKSTKKSDAKLNIVAGKLGQKFGNYYIYVQENKNDTFKDIVIYNRTNKAKEQFFSSKTGKLNKENQQTSLLLSEGYGYTYTPKSLQQAQYRTLEIFDSTKNSNFQFENLLTHWSKAKTNAKIFHRMLLFIFVSLIPLLSLYLVAAFTMINPRYHTNHAFLVIFFTTLGLYMVAALLEKWGTWSMLLLSITLLAILGQWLFYQRVRRYF